VRSPTNLDLNRPTIVAIVEDDDSHDGPVKWVEVRALGNLGETFRGKMRQSNHVLWQSDAEMLCFP